MRITVIVVGFVLSLLDSSISHAACSEAQIKETILSELEHFTPKWERQKVFIVNENAAARFFGTQGTGHIYGVNRSPEERDDVTIYLVLNTFNGEHMVLNRVGIGNASCEIVITSGSYLPMLQIK